ncbi:hypothetical protein FA15DRAFT_671698 [Coprinopsis marcescibilis]|uniref:Uncharacterized protein n=1 Tax=Coprinopsis marcescibilis TaxID=230819 RepID=A0A5C3KNZ3_COPMA|nr:hypothetical protein FA15DRAFT_671698 [Coprinopsis marcescibilis]
MRPFAFLAAAILATPSLGAFVLTDRIIAWREPECTDCTKRVDCCWTSTQATNDLLAIPYTPTLWNCNSIRGSSYTTGVLRSGFLKSGTTTKGLCGASGLRYQANGNNFDFYDTSSGRKYGTCKPVDKSGGAWPLTYCTTDSFDVCNAASWGTPQDYCRVSSNPVWYCEGLC